MYGSVLWRKHFFELAEMFVAIVWEWHGISAMYRRFRALRTIRDRIFCYSSEKTYLHRRSGLSNWVPSKNTTVVVRRDKFTETENMQHAFYLLACNRLLSKCIPRCEQRKTSRVVGVSGAKEMLLSSSVSGSWCSAIGETQRRQKCTILTSPFPLATTVLTISTESLSYFPERCYLSP